MIAKIEIGEQEKEITICKIEIDHILEIARIPKIQIIIMTGIDIIQEIDIEIIQNNRETKILINFIKSTEIKVRKENRMINIDKIIIEVDHHQIDIWNK